MNFAVIFAVSLVLGLILGGLAFRWARRLFLVRTQEEADEIIQEAKDIVEIQDLERQERVQEIEGEAWMKVEADMLKTEEHIEELQEKADEKKQKADQLYSQERQKLVEKDREIKAEEEALRQQESAFQKKREQNVELVRQYVQELNQKLGTTSEETKAGITKRLEEEAHEEARRFLEITEDDTKLHAETRAKQILDIALDRFARPYCPERGMGSVNFPDANVRKLFLDAQGANIKAVQDACGCDIIVEDGSDTAGVAGFDPVRRELTRRTLERIFKEKRNINPDFIRKIAENQKKELFRQIKNDGDAVARELKLENMHPEIRQMMGSLRYRYSFTQNQYFHCAEVGWLCGLLAAELKVDIRKARRSGLLHDIGKAMDHATEGGHAVIGADFIAARNEAPDVVHNVRAHHYDEQPSTDTAFLVIAADAISGARPGARRSTIEAYNQKVSELQDIARSFPGVTEGYVLSGGRELRVFVNSKKVDDHQALDLSRKIATRIEDECSYPGQIKVVVVRETLVSESTMSHKAHA
ncbi:MAG: DUF3552 domain-containing protein [Bdellovibrionaceae bacterium]|nr:DUF3552 domain-containing protein [Pseudobdellovibrionaceae bacterium]